MHLCGVGLEVHSDEELGSLALRGDVAALAVLLERCRPSLYASAVALMKTARMHLTRSKTRSWSPCCGQAMCETSVPSARGCTPCCATSVVRASGNAGRCRPKRLWVTRLGARSGGGARNACDARVGLASARRFEPGRTIDRHAAALQPLQQLRGDRPDHRRFRSGRSAVASTAPGHVWPMRS